MVNSIEELKNFSDKQVAKSGNWSYRFIFVNSKGEKIPLSSRNMNSQICPASTQKIFTASIAYDHKSYSLDKMAIMLQNSDNIMADAALRSVAILPNYANYNSL